MCKDVSRRKVNHWLINRWTCTGVWERVEGERTTSLFGGHIMHFLYKVHLYIFYTKCRLQDPRPPPPHTHLENVLPMPVCTMKVWLLSVVYIVGISGWSRLTIIFCLTLIMWDSITYHISPHRIRLYYYWAPTSCRHVLQVLHNLHSRYLLPRLLVANLAMAS